MLHVLPSGYRHSFPALCSAPYRVVLLHQTFIMASYETSKLDGEHEKVLVDDDNLAITPAQPKFGDAETNVQVQE